MRRRDRRRNRFWSALLVAALLPAACTGSAIETPPTGPIEILAVFNVTGGAKWVDLPGLNGFQLAAEQVNAAGGINGRPIAVVVVDGGSHEFTMAARVRDALDDHDIVAIGGLIDGIHALAPRAAAVRLAAGGLTTFSHSSLAATVGMIGEQAGVPVIAIGSSLPGLPEQIGEHFFGVAAATDRKVSAIVDWAIEEWGAQRAAVLRYAEHDFTERLAALFTVAWRAGGGQVVSQIPFPPGRLDMSDPIARLDGLDPEPDVIFLAGLPNDAGIIVEQLRRAGIDQPVLAADWFDTPLLGAYAGELGDGVYLSTDGALDEPKEGLPQFIAAYEVEYHRPPEHIFAAMGYDTMRLIAAAIEAADETDPAAVREALARIDRFEGVTGTINYRNGARQRSGNIAILRVEDGRFSFVTRWGP